jgi:hypothetical protein
MISDEIFEQEDDDERREVRLRSVRAQISVGCFYDDLDLLVELKSRKRYFR